MSQQKLLGRLLTILDEHRIDYMVTGSIVSSLQGEPRATHNIDSVIQIHESSIPALLDAYQPPRYYLSENSIREAIQHKSMFNLLDTNEGDKIDFWILTGDPFDKSRFERKYEENVFGYSMKVSTPEDTILAKLRWAKLSGGSEKQFTDALRVFEVQYGNLDLSYLETWANQVQVKELWEELKRNASPVE
jgi:hypothetical protein